MNAVQDPETKPAKATVKTGVVVPHPLKWHQRLVASVIYLLIRSVAATTRFKWEFFKPMPSGSPVIFCTWHNRLPFSILLHEGFVKHHELPNRLAAIVSASKDGGVVARILEHFGVQPVRGSSSRRGAQALLEMTSWLDRGYDVAITPDGPRGPCYQVQHGAISLAQVSGLPVVPAVYNLKWKIRLKSWDRFQIPLPFARIQARFGEPLYVPRDISDEQKEALRVEFQRRLVALTED
jgi:lysophospholipid acyltransferase (LPLAT)-like uncharacterized protein